MVYSGGPYISFGTFGNYGEPIGPLNLPYARVSDNVQTIIEKTLTTLFVPWEWWIDYTGAIRIKEERGTDKSGIINLEAAKHIGESSNERSSKQTKQRIRVVGRGESADQDENTGDWHEDTTEMATINSFYEYIQGEKTISSKTEADVWSQVLLALEASINQEITIRLENNPYTTNDFDVGDYITATDSATSISGKVKIKTIETNVNGDGGETTIITCTRRRTDISDRLANMYKTLEKLMLSSTYVDTMYAEGGNQKKLNADIVEDVWEQTASNKWAIELAESESNDPSIQDCVYAGRGAIDYSCNKDMFEIYSLALDAMGQVFLFDPLLKFSRDPRFTCDFAIDLEGETRTAWATDDHVFIRIWERDALCDGADPNNPNKYCCLNPDDEFGDKGFGFEIIKTAMNYELKAYLSDAYGKRSVKVANLTTDTKYTIEARMQYKEKVVLFYFGKSDVEESDPDWGFRLRAILPMSILTGDCDNLCPFHIILDASSGTTKPAVVIYRWKTQAVRAVKE